MKRDKIMHIAFLEHEKVRIKKYAKYYNTTSSEFIRQAIFDKIRRIENPELYYTHQVIKREVDNFWNVILLLDRVAADTIFRDNNHWENYKTLWNTPLWYAGVNLKRIFDGNPKGSFHHKGKYMTNYTRIFTNGKFVENHRRGSME